MGAWGYKSSPPESLMLESRSVAPCIESARFIVVPSVVVDFSLSSLIINKGNLPSWYPAYTSQGS